PWKSAKAGLPSRESKRVSAAKSTSRLTCRSIEAVYSARDCERTRRHGTMTASEAGAATVLVVDDDEDIRLILAQILSLQGYDAPTAANGLDALSQLYDGVEPCLILLDLMMPAMSGWEFRTKQLQDPKLAQIPVVVLSG